MIPAAQSGEALRRSPAHLPVRGEILFLFESKPLIQSPGIGIPVLDVQDDGLPTVPGLGEEFFDQPGPDPLIAESRQEGHLHQADFVLPAINIDSSGPLSIDEDDVVVRVRGLRSVSDILSRKLLLQNLLLFGRRQVGGRKDSLPGREEYFF